MSACPVINHETAHGMVRSCSCTTYTPTNTHEQTHTHEERERGVDAGVNATKLVRNTIDRTGRRSCRKGVSVAKKTMNLCACDSEEREHGVGAGVLLETLQLWLSKRGEIIFFSPSSLSLK